MTNVAVWASFSIHFSGVSSLQVMYDQRETIIWVIVIQKRGQGLLLYVDTYHMLLSLIEAEIMRQTYL